jgi:hypothetical protein
VKIALILRKIFKKYGCRKWVSPAKSGRVHMYVYIKRRKKQQLLFIKM